MKKKFPKNNDFAQATLSDILGDTILANSLHYKAFTFASSYIENLGNMKFRISPFDNYAQVSNQNSILTGDIDRDGNLDLIMAGNLYSSEVETIRNDAGTGIFLKGNGKGGFKSMPYIESGLYADGDIKKMKWMNADKGPIIICAKNNDYLQFIKVNQKKSTESVY